MTARRLWIALLGGAVALVVALLFVQNQRSLSPAAKPSLVATAPTPRQIGGEGGTWFDYDPTFFAADLKVTKTVLVAVHADWCIDCQAQAPIMSRLLREPAFKDAVGYIVDFDHDRAFLAAHKVRTQSTLIVFKDGVEVDRAVAITNEAAIRNLFEEGL